MEWGEQKGYRWCGGMYLGIGEGEGGADMQGVCRVGWKVEGAGSLLESDGWVVEVRKVEVRVWKVEAEVWKAIRKLGEVRFSNMTFMNLSQHYNT